MKKTSEAFAASAFKPHSLLVFFATLLITSCSSDQPISGKIRPGGTYRIPLTTEIITLDPVSGEVSAWTVGSQIYEGLVAYSEDESEILPLLAESYTITDTSIHFQLRRGVRFHDDACFPGGIGRELTASDIKYSFERYYTNNVSVRTDVESIQGMVEFLSGKARELRGLRVHDRYMLEIRLTTPDPDLLTSLTSHSMFIIPHEAVSFYKDEFGLHPVGTGPFRFSELIPNDKLILVRNENYWDSYNEMQLPFLDAIEYIFYSPGENEKILLDFQTGKIDESAGQIAGLIEEFVEIEDSRIVIGGPFKGQEIQLVKDHIFRKLRYLQLAEPNVKVRRAMAHAINRKRLVANQNNPFQSFAVAKGVNPPNSPYFDPELQGQFYDPDMARELLEEAGYPGGDGLPEYLLISLPSGDVDLIIEDFSAIGITLIKQDPFPGWRKLLGKQPTLLVRLVNTNTSPEPQEVYKAFNQNVCQDNPTFVRLYREWQRDNHTYRDKELLSRLEQIIAEISPVIFLYHIDGEFRFLQSYVRGRQIGTALGHKLHYVWLDRAKKT